MHTYLAFYHGKKYGPFNTNTLYEAQLLAVAAIKPPKSKRHMVSVYLVEKGGEEVVHTADT